MAAKDEEFRRKLLATFRVEADEHLATIASGLLALEQAAPGAAPAAVIEQIFREAHSLKGAARAVNLTAVESLCQSLEGAFAALKRGAALSPALFDLLHRTLDALGALLGPEGGARPPVAALAAQLDEAARGAAADSAASSEPPAPPPPETGAPPGPRPLPATPGLGTDTVRVATAKLDLAMRQTEELLGPRLATEQRARELRETGATLALWKKERDRIRPALHMMERLCARAEPAAGAAREQKALAQVFEYLESEAVRAKTLEDRMARLARAAERDQRTLGAMVEGLAQDVKEMQLMPCAALLEAFPRFARELARDRGKEVVLAVRGGEIEIDRRILEELKDPLIHLLRNGVDHGIEPPALRAERGKPPQGTITIAVSQTDSGKAEILVADDGGGIDVARVKAAAGRLGLLGTEEAERLGEREALALVFRSGITTSPIITDVSGRGLGLAIVREKVERLGGAIALDTGPGAGTTFRFIVPLSLATVRAVLVRAGDRVVAIPSVGVERVVRVAAGEVRTVENRETIAVDGQAVALASLAAVLELPPPPAVARAPERIAAIVIALAFARLAFRVDEVLGEQEVLVKGLGPQLARVRNVAGASVLGTGRVVPVLNLSDLVKSAVQRAGAPAAAAVPKGSILVAEDSITARALLKNILEAAGYRVATAVDGIDAFTALKTGTFDLIVSDVEMPRMNGFDLTARVRADRKLAELPIVLVTALEAREDRERGIDVGANAYIVKSSFDQSNLLEVVERLIG